MTVRIIKDYETDQEFKDRLVLIDMGEPGLFAIRHDPAFLLEQVHHEYVCFDARHGEVVRLDETALEALQEISA